jgi:hypothetical protein
VLSASCSSSSENPDGLSEADAAAAFASAYSLNRTLFLYSNMFLCNIFYLVAAYLQYVHLPNQKLISVLDVQIDSS